MYDKKFINELDLLLAGKSGELVGVVSWWGW